MIETDGRPTIASRRADPLLREALEKGGHLGDEVARVLLADEKATVEKVAVLEIGSWSSKCGECGKSADPNELEHKTVLGWGREPKPPGCGVRWTHVTATYLGMDKRVVEMRPDLELIPIMPPEAGV